MYFPAFSFKRSCFPQSLFRKKETKRMPGERRKGGTIRRYWLVDLVIKLSLNRESSCFFAFMIPQTHTHTHTHTKNTHTHAGTYTHTHAHTHTHTHANTHTNTNSHTHAHTHTCTRTHTRLYTKLCTHTETHKLTHAHARTCNTHRISRCAHAPYIIRQCPFSSNLR